MIDMDKVIENLEKAKMIIEKWVPMFEQYNTPFGIDVAIGLLKEQPEIVRCKNCIHNGKVEKCVLAAIAAEKDCSLFMLDYHGEWYCADGKRR